MSLAAEIHAMVTEGQPLWNGRVLVGGASDGSAREVVVHFMKLCRTDPPAGFLEFSAYKTGEDEFHAVVCCNNEQTVRIYSTSEGCLCAQAVAELPPDK
jgi:hypothetical protein